MTDDPTIHTPSDFEFPAEKPAVAAGSEAAADAATADAAERDTATWDAPPTGPSAAEAWEEVVVRLRELGDAISAWTKAAADTPENRKHLEEVRSGVNEVARQANDAFSSVASGDVGRQISEGATQMGHAIGEGAQELGAAAAPHVASMFAGLADMFGHAAQKVGESVPPPAPSDAQASVGAEPAEPAPEAPVAPQPPVPPTDESE